MPETSLAASVPIQVRQSERQERRIANKKDHAYQSTLVRVYMNSSWFQSDREQLTGKRVCLPTLGKASGMRERCTLHNKSKQ